MSIAELKAELKEDNSFIRYRSIRETAERQLPFDKLCDEIEMIQQSRMARTSAHNMKPKQLLDVSLDEVSHRARLTEIMVQAKRARNDLAPVVDGLWHHIKSTYSDELRSFKTSGERDSAVSTVLNAGYKFISNLDSLVEQCTDVIKEIDQTSFSLTRVANMFELVIRHEKLVNVDV